MSRQGQAQTFCLGSPLEPPECPVSERRRHRLPPSVRRGEALIGARSVSNPGRRIADTQCVRLSTRCRDYPFIAEIGRPNVDTAWGSVLESRASELCGLRYQAAAPRRDGSDWDPTCDPQLGSAWARPGSRARNSLGLAG